MTSFNICFESLRLSLGPLVSKDLFKLSHLLHNPNNTLESLANIYKKSPNACSIHINEANLLFLMFLFEEQSPDFKVQSIFLSRLLSNI